jgi:hypothetical protein
MIRDKIIGNIVYVKYKKYYIKYCSGKIRCKIVSQFKIT